MKCYLNIFASVSLCLFFAVSPLLGEDGVGVPKAFYEAIEANDVATAKKLIVEVQGADGVFLAALTEDYFTLLDAVMNPDFTKKVKIDEDLVNEQLVIAQQEMILNHIYIQDAVNKGNDELIKEIAEIPDGLLLHAYIKVSPYPSIWPRANKDWSKENYTKYSKEFADVLRAGIAESYGKVFDSPEQDVILNLLRSDEEAKMMATKSLLVGAWEYNDFAHTEFNYVRIVGW